MPLPLMARHHALALDAPLSQRHKPKLREGGLHHAAVTLAGPGRTEPISWEPTTAVPSKPGTAPTHAAAEAADSGGDRRGSPLVRLEALFSIWMSDVPVLNTLLLVADDEEVREADSRPAGLDLFKVDEREKLLSSLETSISPSPLRA
eukprot:CAMPEP_0202422012 /NCGR_PEP_ID=MMETSP1128-20130828/50637_1 /ASSEMBLY_ACC=CAM_ASM_000463 /TAXON_ID=3047 /ORGANISM="Dunaliella tertiolecta, Strain CCMP1320" /LENGTH=147 /DNA_ID=CAMNT_0049030057 /DNA_START=1226 /DNA_END=1666 /DNA_ORIENTATION=-